MKYLFLIFSLLNITMVLSQAPDGAVCYVAAVKGEIRMTEDKIIMTGDKISISDIPALKYISDGSQLILFNSTYGSFRLPAKELPVTGAKESLINFLAHLLKIKGRPVSLSSRGGCECAAPQGCFFTDTTLNDKVLMVDSLSFIADELLSAAKTGFYFLQYNMKDRKPLRKKLKIENGVVYITPKDLIFEDSIFKEGETAELVLGLYIKEEEGESSNLVAHVKFKTVPATILQDYYTALKTAMQGSAPEEIYDEFCRGVYILFGKPNECQLKRIIDYPN